MIFLETSIFTQLVADAMDDDSYRKNERADLTPTQLKVMKSIVEEYKK